MKHFNKQAIINSIEATQTRNDLPVFRSGDTISVTTKFVEGVKTRIQKLTGVVIRVRGSGLNKNFILRRETSGV
jgi:large subunit ribosomal protein L19